MLVCGRKTDGVAFRVKPRDYPTIQFFYSGGVWTSKRTRFGSEYMWERYPLTRPIYNPP